MQVSDLFSEQMEPALNEWIKKFTSPDDLFAALPQLYAKLEFQNIDGSVEDGAIILGWVHVGIGSIVQSQAIIRGPAIIGSDTVVGSHAEIQAGSFIGSKCTIGHGCSIVESMVMNNCYIWPNAFIRNSVIGFGSVVGPGAVLGADIRKPLGKAMHLSSCFGVMLGDYSAVGANSTLGPGTVAGPRAIIGEQPT